MLPPAAADQVGAFLELCLSADGNRDNLTLILEGRRIASVPLRRGGGGKSELHRARCRV